MATLFKTNGEVLEVQPTNKKTFSLKELQSYVGGYVQVFRMNNKVFIVNEEGFNLELPFNQKASDFLQEQTEYKTQKLVGDVLVLDDHNQIN